MSTRMYMRLKMSARIAELKKMYPVGAGRRVSVDGQLQLSPFFHSP